MYGYESDGRLGELRDIANACLFLASDGASFITGETLRVDTAASWWEHSVAVSSSAKALGN